MVRGVLANFARSEGAVRKLLIACMAIGFVSLIAAALGAAWLTRQRDAHGAAIVHTYDVELAVAQARIGIEQTETTRRGYILTGERIYLDSYRDFNRQLPSALTRLRLLTADNPGQQARIAVLRGRLAELLRQREETIRQVMAGRREIARDEFVAETSARRLRAIRDTFDAMTAEEQRLLALRDAELARSQTLFYWLLSLAGLMLALVAITSLLTVLRYTRDLNSSAARLAEANESLEERVRLRTADLTRANEEIQRFAYIVSHDLRSPLVNVMGFTAELDAATKTVVELIDRVRAQAPDAVTAEDDRVAREDLPEAISFIRASTAKMDRLINAILKLSREGRRVLSPEPIDMTALVAGIRDSLAHVADDRGVTITVEPLPSVVSDRVAVEQIFSNLVENATKYLEPGRAGQVTIAGRKEGARGVFTVTDNGRGIDPKDHARIFDLFRRSGRQDQPGEGIGLAHARALAIRLGGMIEVDSALGQGASFRVSLPLQYASTEDRNQ
jgi:signal transduction histidine kinase